MPFYIVLFLFSALSLNGAVTLNNINTKPPCRAKDFMIWQYLQQDITPLEAKKAYSQVSSKGDKFLFLYAKKTDDEKIKQIVSCKKNTNLLEIEDKNCLKLAINPYKTLKLSNEQRNELYNKLESNSTKKILQIQNEPYTQESYAKYDAKTFLNFFIKMPSGFRRKNLNIDFDKNFINNLASYWKISTFISIVVCDVKLENVKRSLLYLKSDKLNAQSVFFLAINQLLHSNEKKAISLFEEACEKSKKQIDKDKNIFWIYLVSKDKKYLKKLLLSMDINIYTIYAHEVLNESFENYFITLPTTDKVANLDIKNPFQWHKILQEIKTTPKENLFNLAQKYRQKQMLPVQSFIVQKAYRFKVHGYIMPYDKYLQNLTTDEKALVYAIMRQESHLIPSALSYSYALGLMQLMPFLVDIIAKECNENICYEDMFKPQKNIQYALKHLQWMQKSLYHPLFIAYAYNGGMGFFRRYLKSGRFENKRYEPFLSMEIMSNTQSREYGKRVLANYVMYKKALGEDVSIVYLFYKLRDRKKNSRF